MNNYRLSEQSEIYKDALAAVEGIAPPAVGFSKPEPTGATNFNIIIKQNNIIIQLLTKIAEDAQQTKEDLGEVKRSLTTLINRDSNTSAKALEDVIKQLENWKPEDKRPPVQKKPGPYFVFKDPYDQLKKEKEKAIKSFQ